MAYPTGGGGDCLLFGSMDTSMRCKRTELSVFPTPTKAFVCCTLHFKAHNERSPSLSAPGHGVSPTPLFGSAYPSSKGGLWVVHAATRDLQFSPLPAAHCIAISKSLSYASFVCLITWRRVYGTPSFGEFGRGEIASGYHSFTKHSIYFI